MSLKKYVFKKTFLYSIIYILFGCSLSIILIKISMLIEKIVDLLINGETNISKIIYFTLGLIVIYIIFDFIYFYLLKKVEAISKKVAIKYCFKKIGEKNIEDFKKNGVGEINYYITKLGPELGEYYGTFWQNLFINFISITILFWRLLSTNYLIGFIIIIGIFILIYLTSFVSKKLSLMTSRIEEEDANLEGFIQDHFLGIKIVKTLQINSRRIEKLENCHLEPKYKLINHKNKWYTSYVVIYDLLTIIFPILVLIIGLYFKEKDLIAIGGVIALYSLTGTLQEPIRNIADSITYFKENKQREFKMKKMLNIGGINSNLVNDFNNSEINNIQVRISRVKFSKNILINKSFKFDRNEINVLKGPSGIGKSTILNIIIGYFTEYEGTCLYDNKQISNSQINYVYKNIGYINQSSYLFKDSILSNITMDCEFNDDELKEIIEICMLKSLINRFNLKDKIDWSNSNISGGEMQRINIARILIRKPCFILMDEVTSALDIQTTQKLVKNIICFSKKYNIGLIVVSHKNEFDNYADKIIEVD